MNRKKHGTYLVKYVVHSHVALHFVALLHDRFHTNRQVQYFRCDSTMNATTIYTIANDLSIQHTDKVALATEQRKQKLNE